MKFKRNLGPVLALLSTVSLLSLSACSGSNASNVAPSNAVPEATTAPAAVSTPEAMAPVADQQQVWANMTQDLAAAEAAIKVKDFARAKAKFESFDEGWDRVEDGVKEKSKDAYKQIEEGIDGVKNTLTRPAQPNAEKAAAALQTLAKTVQTYQAP